MNEEKQENPFDGVVFNARSIVERWIGDNKEAQSLGYIALRDLEDLIDVQLKKARGE